MPENTEKTALYHKLRHLHGRHMTRFVNTDVSSICKYMRPPSLSLLSCSLHGTCIHHKHKVHFLLLPDAECCLFFFFLIECVALGGAAGHKAAPGVRDQGRPCGEAPPGWVISEKQSHYRRCFVIVQSCSHTDERQLIPKGQLPVEVRLIVLANNEMHIRLESWTSWLICAFKKRHCWDTIKSNDSRCLWP